MSVKQPNHTQAEHHAHEGREVGDGLEDGHEEQPRNARDEDGDLFGLADFYAVSTILSERAARPRLSG